MVDSVFRLTRDQIVQFAKTPQQVRFFENLQSMSASYPNDILLIYSAIQDAAVTAEISLSSALVLLSEIQQIQESADILPIPYIEPDDEQVLYPVPNLRNPGWATYKDTVYTSGSPFAIASGVTSTLPNNAGTIVNTNLPNNTADFYNASTLKLLPSAAGEHYIFTIKFSVVAASGTVNFLEFAIDVGGTLIAKQTKTLPKGTVAHNISIVCQVGILDTFITNGGLVKITSGAVNMSYYDIEYQIAKVIQNENP